MPPSTSPLSIAQAFRVSMALIILISIDPSVATTKQPNQSGDSITKSIPQDPRWPFRQLNVLVDKKLLNETEQLILATVFNQLERRTCLKIQRLPDNWLNITELRHDKSITVQEQDKNFVHIGKSLFKTHNKLVGFSSLGCVRKGRQSLVLTDLAFRWPDVVLRYHILRTLGVDGIERPDDNESKRGNQLPQSQRIVSNEKTNVILTANNLSTYGPRVEYLREEDLEKIKHLYDCPEIHNRLSVKPILDAMSESTTSSLLERKYTTSPIRKPATNPDPTKQRKLDDRIIDGAAKKIVENLIDMSTTSAYCSSTRESDCLTSTTQNVKPMQSERPMVLKLDGTHSQDPHLLQTDQIRIGHKKKAKSNATLAGPQLMNGPDMDSWQQQQQQKPPFVPQMKQELIMSFEANNQFNGNAIDGLASSQVLKLCSCSCQTMRPQPTEPPQPPQPTYPPFTLPPVTETPTFPATEIPPYTRPSPTMTEPPPTTRPTTTTTPEPTTMSPWPTSTTATTTQQPVTTTTEAPPRTSIITTPVAVDTTTTSAGPMSYSFCDLVQWVQPNKTVYASSRIVWDVDRGNQNYFLCSTIVNGALIPGKTHGLSCKVSNEGIAYETHEFSVLTKPEHVSLAWVQRNSDSFGKTNFPVVGGFSKAQDPLIVSRCLVRDENNDVITLIGYVNNHGTGWFPFDDIQIECAQYDVLACVG